MRAKVDFWPPHMHIYLHTHEGGGTHTVYNFIREFHWAKGCLAGW